MSRFETLAQNLRDSLDGLAEGWQDLWQKARNALTRFTPFEDETGNTIPSAIHTSRWGVMSAELQETDDALEVNLEAPGMKREDFDIRIDGRYLSISGKKHYSSDRKEGRFHITERAYGSFERVIPIPCDVDVGKATYKNGVLHLTLPKQAQNRVRRIEVT